MHIKSVDTIIAKPKLNGCAIRGNIKVLDRVKAKIIMAVISECRIILPNL